MKSLEDKDIEEVMYTNFNRTPISGSFNRGQLPGRYNRTWWTMQQQRLHVRHYQIYSPQHLHCQSTSLACTINVEEM